MFGKKIHITGIVQGVGFRPYIYNLAQKYHLTGWVQNTSAGVDIEIEGKEESQIKDFLSELSTNPPPLSRVDGIKIFDHQIIGFTQFEIKKSEATKLDFQPISPDIATCKDCLHEFSDPDDRRYRYPFINCTNCGPRFTIIADMPYDRPKTTMFAFPMCAECQEEYLNPANRRFHAQPVACPKCGPQIWLEQPGDEVNNSTAQLIYHRENAIQEARRLISVGKIIAIKGLGGFHLACNAKDRNAVTVLRQRKMRVDKPFAVMMPDIETIKKYCHISESEQVLLESPAHPILLLRKKSSLQIANEVAPQQSTIGVMLPYTPLHYLLAEQSAGFTDILVMTSGNISNEPICIENNEAKKRLSHIADAFLLHNREIQIHTDDSVLQLFKEKIYPIRRSRGYSPFPLQLPWEVPPVLAVGTELKNTFCLTQKKYAFMSQHIGDLENYETLESFEKSIEHFEHIFRVKPEALACDLHPNYLATRYALERGNRDNIPVISVQHHHAHIASIMAENKLGGDTKVIGVIFDGTGFGNDESIWGGEFLLADYVGFSRVAHLKKFPLPGGDTSTRRPSRIALALLHTLEMDWYENLLCTKDLSEKEKTALKQQLEKGINCPDTSSAGRLFDAVSSLLGVRQRVNYEAQAAIELESIVDPQETGQYDIESTEGEIDIKPLILSIVSDINKNKPVGEISGKFHNSIAHMVANKCQQLMREYQVLDVALSGGVWQNITLLEKTLRLLSKTKCNVYIHQHVPTNDGGIALGQAAIAGYSMLKNRR